jgi:aspartyl-tRNA(Asn)/glutamyl-tRNA(Gln) amidotransferase subunit A
MAGHRLTIRQVARLLDVGLVTSEQLSSFCNALAVAGEEVWGLNAYTNIVDREELLDRAKESDARRKHGEVLSPFDGIPISVKANLAVENQPLTAGSLILGMGRNDAPPCGYDADTVKIMLRDCGALLVGVTSMDEFGMGSLGNNSRSLDGSPRLTKNPLPLLRNLGFNYSSEAKSDDEGIAGIIQMPQDDILELHSEALDGEEGVYSAGGSSCGSAVSVAHGSALLSLGTDTGGSVRLPSAWCGLVGLKPSYGLLSRHGVVSYASSFDTVGVLANSVDCATLALDALAQRGEVSRDSTFSAYRQSESMPKSVDGEKESLNGLRIGIPSSFSVKECPANIREAWSRAAECLHQHGASIEEISTEDISPGLVQRALAAYYVLVSAEASSNLSRYDGFRYGVASENNVFLDPESDSDLTPLERQYSATRMEGFGTEVARRILCGTSVLSSDRFHTHYESAAKLRAALARQLNSVLQEKVDLLLIPTALSLPCRIDQDEVDNTAMFANDIMTVPSSLAGLPSVSVPIRIAEEDTFMGGLQLIGPRLREDLVLKVGKILETASYNK